MKTKSIALAAIVVMLGLGVSSNHAAAQVAAWRLNAAVYNSLLFLVLLLENDVDENIVNYASRDLD